MKVAKFHQADSPSNSSLNKEADEFVVVAMMSGSALHGTEPVNDSGTPECISSMTRSVAC